LKEVYLYTDGACRGNPGRGGWGAVLVFGKYEREMSGGEALTTNNRMELTAAIEGLRALKEPCIVRLYSDSKYLTDAYNLGWVDKWREAGWHKKGGELLNPDLWQTLDGLVSRHEVHFNWVKGHNGHPYNERCDRLATAYADSFE